MSGYLLDTNILIFLLRGMRPALRQRLAGFAPGKLSVSVCTVAELVHGCHKSSDPRRNYLALLQFLLPYRILDWKNRDVESYALIRAGLEKMGTPIGTIDTFIAAQARSRGLTLITNNVREFARVPGITIEDWSQAGE